MRTHPMMNCSGTGGYILSGIKVMAPAVSADVAKNVAGTTGAGEPKIVDAQFPAVVPPETDDQKGVKRGREGGDQ